MIETGLARSVELREAKVNCIGKEYYRDFVNDKNSGGTI